MTTTTLISHDDVKRFVAAHIAEEAALPDPSKIVLAPDEAERTWRTRQRLMWERQRAVGLWETIARKSSLSNIEAPVLDAMLAAKAAFERDVAAFDPVVARRSGIEGDLNWRNHEAKVSALDAINGGVEHYNGKPALPGALYSFLASRGVSWKGPLPMLEERTAKLQAEIAAAYAELATLLNNGKSD